MASRRPADARSRTRDPVHRRRPSRDRSLRDRVPAGPRRPRPRRRPTRDLQRPRLPEGGNREDRGRHAGARVPLKLETPTSTSDRPPPAPRKHTADQQRQKQARSTGLRRRRHTSAIERTNADEARAMRGYFLSSGASLTRRRRAPGRRSRVRERRPRRPSQADGRDTAERTRASPSTRAALGKRHNDGGAQADP
jgi:hypothetical protein